MAGTSMGVSHKKKSKKSKNLSCNTNNQKQDEDPELGLELGLMNAQLLDVRSGYDVVKCIQDFCRTRKVGICVLGGTGMISQATVKTSENTINIHGKVVGGSVVGEIVALGPLLLVAAAAPSIPKNCELVGHETSG